MTDLAPALLGPAVTVTVADDRRDYHRLRHHVFVEEQRLFERTDRDDRDGDPRTVVLVARSARGEFLGGVRCGPAGGGPDIGWWVGGRLVVDPAVRGAAGVGPALVRAAQARVDRKDHRTGGTVQVVRYGARCRIGGG